MMPDKQVVTPRDALKVAIARAIREGVNLRDDDLAEKIVGIFEAVREAI